MNYLFLSLIRHSIECHEKYSNYVTLWQKYEHQIPIWWQQKTPNRQAIRKDNPDSLYINIVYQLQKHYDYCKINTIQNIVILISKSRFKDFLLPKMQKYNRKGTSKPKELTMRMGGTAHQWQSRLGGCQRGQSCKLIG